MVGLQKANFGKRIIAAIFDGILLSIIAVGLAAVLSTAFGYDGYINTVQSVRDEYQKEYNVDFAISAEKYNELTEAERENFLKADEAFRKDQRVVYAYNMLISLTMLITTIPLLVAFVVIEFLVPKLLGNGQTLGKKIFGIALMHTEGIEITGVQLFARAVLGKFAIELMIPLSMIFMILTQMIGVVGIAVLLAILVAQIICLVSSKTNSLIHDVMSATVAVDMASQRIFKDREALLNYTKRIAAEKAAKADY